MAGLEGVQDNLTGPKGDLIGPKGGRIRGSSLELLGSIKDIFEVPIILIKVIFVYFHKVG